MSRRLRPQIKKLSFSLNSNATHHKRILEHIVTKQVDFWHNVQSLIIECSLLNPLKLYADDISISEYSLWRTEIASLPMRLFQMSYKWV